jgi:hypothetical protein
LAKFQLHRKIPIVRGIYTRLDEARRERDALAEELHSTSARLEEVRHQRDESAAQLSRISASFEQAAHERDGLASEIRSLAREVDETTRDRDRVVAHRDRLKSALSYQFRTVLTEADNASLPSTPTAETQGLNNAVDDVNIVERIIAAYKLAVAAAAPPSDSFWEQSFFDLKRDVHEALCKSDSATVRGLLRDPGKTDLLYGFEDLARSMMHRPRIANRGLSVYLDLLFLSEAIGARRLWNPEAANRDYVESLPDVEALLVSIEEHIGFRVTFPNPFVGERGLPTSRGIASVRAVQSLYQAWLAASLVRGIDSRVLEIGAGAGRTAFYANQLGLTDYTIIDLPMTNVAQANFLGRALGQDAVTLFREEENRHRIRILPSTAFFSSDDKYDLVVNVDSLTEMSLDTARSYCEEIKKRAQTFLSINHEYNAFTVRNICSATGFPKGSRQPYWMRRGYVEELFRF